MPQHHVIVGDGITAAEFAATRTMAPGDSLTMIGPNIDQPGRGVAYAKAPPDAPWRYAYLFNSPSYAVDTDFAQWLGDNWQQVSASMQGRKPDWLAAAKPYSDRGDIAALNAPRELYGDFSQRRTEAALDRHRQSGVNVRLIKSCVKHIEKNDNGLLIETADGQQLIANTADIATGGPVNQRFALNECDEYGECDASYPELFGFEERLAERLRNGGSVISIGANAAMLDLLRFCQSVQTEAQIKLTAVSPSGTIPFPLRPSATRRQTPVELSGPYTRAADFLRDLEQLKDTALADGYSLEEIRAGLRSLFMSTSLTEFIPDTAEARKIAKPLYRSFQGGTRDSVDDFTRLQQTGNTAIVAGKVINIKKSRDGAAVAFEDSNGMLHSISASVVVNCAGPGRTAGFDSFTNNLIRQKYIDLCPESGGVMVGANCQSKLDGVRYLGPAVTMIGDIPEPVPFYDTLKLRKTVERINAG